MFTKIFRSSKGVFDLTSVMTGVIITGLMLTIAVAAFVTVVPWLFKNQADNVVTAVKVAENSARQDYGAYATLDVLINDHYVSEQPLPVCVQIVSGGADYNIFVQDGRDVVYRYNSVTDETAEWTTAPGCTLQ